MAIKDIFGALTAALASSTYPRVHDLQSFQSAYDWHRKLQGGLPDVNFLVELESASSLQGFFSSIRAPYCSAEGRNLIMPIIKPVRFVLTFPTHPVPRLSRPPPLAQSKVACPSPLRSWSSTSYCPRR